MSKIASARIIECFVLFVGMSLAASQPAHAYLDPGSGSYALQVAIAGLFSLMFSVKMFWGKLKETFFPGRSSGVESKKDSAATLVNE